MKKNRKSEGTGLGLAITKRLVNLMQGDIQVESEYGKGTKFIIQIKQKVLDKRTIQEVPMTRGEMEDKQGRMFVCENYKVLVVDDNMINRKVATAMLASYAFQIHEANSGENAIEMVKKQDYDMIFMDHMMPEMDGMEATRIIRTECGENAKKAIIIALTANAIQGAREMYLKNGFEDFLSKPFERSQMHELLERWIPEEKRAYVEETVEQKYAIDRKEELKEQNESKKSKAEPENELAKCLMSGVNVWEVVNRLDDGVEKYLELLEAFLVDGRERKERMYQLAQDKDYDNYAIEIHALKSAAMNIGAEKLSKEAEEHELSIQEGQYEFVDRKYAQLSVNYERILIEIEHVLNKNQRGREV